MKAKKITPADRKLMQSIISKLSDSEKEMIIADLVLFAERAMPILDELIKQSDLTPKEKREIEDSISLGPQWLNYKRRVVRQK